MSAHTDREDFIHRYGPWALIAGASEGIGESFAHRLAAAGVNVVLLARRIEPLQRLAAELVATHAIEVRLASLDLTEASVMDDLAPVVADLEVGMLVYNAGASTHVGEFVEQPVEDALHLVNLNCRGPVLLAHHFGSAMARRRRGGIVLISSTAAIAGGARVATYSASKSFELIFGEALWIELGQYDVDVVVAMAGLTDTPAMRLRNPGLALDGSVQMMSSDAVADEALGALGGGDPFVPVGPDNRAAVHDAWRTSRADLVLGMSAGSANLYHLPVPVRPGPTAGERTGNA